MNRPDVIVPFAAIAALLVSVVVIYLRQGRNRVLEEIVEKSELGPITSFQGTLAVQENRPGFFLRLSKNSKERQLQSLYRWVIGMGPQAAVDQVTFDASRRVVELVRDNKQNSLPFAEFSSIRMREDAVSFKRGLGRHGSIWHVELLSGNGSRLVFLSSEPKYRRRAFEETAAVAKEVSMIMSIPVQVVVDGKAWTLGWPPKALLS